MPDSLHPKRDGTRTVIGKNGIKGNLPSEKAKIAPTVAPSAVDEVGSRSQIRRIAIMKGEPAPEFRDSVSLDNSSSVRAPEQVKTALALRARLETLWDEETSAGGYTPELPSTGQCAITSMIVQDILGGELLRVMNVGISHYFNRLEDGTEIDLTRDQFPVWDPEPAVVRERSYLDGSQWTLSRYKLLCDKLDIPAKSI